MLDEKEYRKTGWVDGEWIALADGGRWSFPRPVIEFGPEFGADGSIELGKPRPTLDAAYDAKIESLITATDGIEEFRAVMCLAVDLLGRNYELGPDQYRVLLRRRVRDEQNAEMWRAINEVVIGNDAPKPTAGGSGSPAGSPGSPAP